jgi:hypothetical protein
MQGPDRLTTQTRERDMVLLPPAETLWSRNSWRWLRCLHACACLALAAVLGLGSARASEVSEFEVKAAALFNIIEFTEWPATAFSSPDTPFVIGVLGRGPVAPIVEGLSQTETWHGRRIVVERYATPAEVKACHVIYIEQSAHARWTSIRSLFTGRPILTVSDAPDFTRQSGTVQFNIERNKLRLSVNISSARLSALKISSKVLRLAEVVGENP